MSLFQHTLTILNRDGEPIESLEAWVDMGSTYTLLPRSVFEALRIVPSEEREFILATGARERKPVAQVQISLGGAPFYTYCAVADDGEELLLGAVALEEAGLAVDPVKRRLVLTSSS